MSPAPSSVDRYGGHAVSELPLTHEMAVPSASPKILEMSA